MKIIVSFEWKLPARFNQTLFIINFSYYDTFLIIIRCISIHHSRHIIQQAVRQHSREKETCLVSLYNIVH